MSEALKKINKKYLIVVAAIFIVLIMIIVIVAITRSCDRPGEDYKKVEEKLVDAAKSYYKSNNDKLPSTGKNDTINASVLSEKGYMKGLSNYLKDTSCTASVNVYNNGGQYLFIPDLKCSEYSTLHLSDKIIEDNLVTSNYDDNQSQSDNSQDVTRDYVSGLYDDNGIYVFKGKNPNNYLTFGNTTWRIIDINAEGVIRVIKSEPESRVYSWDTKYNSEIQKTVGINDYKNSLILEKLNSEYAKFKDESKLHLTPFGVCVGKREKSNLNKDRSVDCSSILEDQYISLISSSDYARASLDENCDSIINGACNNYNYMSYFLHQSWTTSTVTDNTYEAIYINSGQASALQARKTATYNWVVAFNGFEKYISGSGTEKDPYVLGSKAKK